MEEAKIKAYRVQVTDLESGDTVMDNITPACLCVTFIDGNESLGEYSSTVQYKKDIVPIKVMFGLAKAAKVATQDALTMCMQDALSKLIDVVSESEKDNIIDILKQLAEEEDEDD